MGGIITGMDNLTFKYDGPEYSRPVTMATRLSEDQVLISIRVPHLTPDDLREIAAKLERGL